MNIDIIKYTKKKKRMLNIMFYVLLAFAISNFIYTIYTKDWALGASIIMLVGFPLAIFFVIYCIFTVWELQNLEER